MPDLIKWIIQAFWVVENKEHEDGIKFCLFRGKEKIGKNACYEERLAMVL